MLNFSRKKSHHRTLRKKRITIKKKAMRESTGEDQTSKKG